MIFAEDLKNKKTIVAGLGKSGIAAVKLLHSKGFKVSACDSNDLVINNPQVKKLVDEEIEIFTGKDFPKAISESRCIVLSPGIDQRDNLYKDAAKKGSIVTGELELAWSFINKPVVAITGTNGKSTVTELISDILEYSGKKVFRGGNLGTPISSAVMNQDDYDLMVIEVSSFQLDTIHEFAPDVALLLNITPDHLDRYENFNAYRDSKLRIFKNQGKKQISILNKKDGIDLESDSQISYFNFDSTSINSSIHKDNELIVNFNNKKTIINTDKFSLQGKHNLENLSAAAITALEAGASFQGLEMAIKEFKGLPHRMEYCGSINKIKFINDSKATNPDSVLKALEGMDGDISLIMGGKDKGYNYSYLENIVNKKVKNLILMGETREKIKREICFKGNIFLETSMENAVKKAYQSLDKGVVLLSPACSSFDMFESYGHRGKEFYNQFSKLKENQRQIENE